MIKQYIISDGQDLFDAAIQIYGKAESAWRFLPLNDSLSLTSFVPPGFSLN